MLCYVLLCYVMCYYVISFLFAIFTLLEYYNCFYVDLLLYLFCSIYFGGFKESNKLKLLFPGLALRLLLTISFIPLFTSFMLCK